MNSFVTQALPREKQWDMTGPDPVLIVLFSSLILFGLMMVFSATIGYGHGMEDGNFDYLKLQLMYLLIGLTCTFFIAALPVKLWQQYNIILFIVAIILLVLVLIPSIGLKINGSKRWLNLGFFRMQPSELMKLIIIFFAANYIVKIGDRIQEFVAGIGVILATLILVAGLLMLEPDLGTSVVILVTVFSMLFLSGVRILHYLPLVLLGFASILIAIKACDN